MKNFRILQQVTKGYDEQGYIFFTSRLFPVLPEEDRKSIEDLCRSIAGGAWRSLLDFVRGEGDPRRIAFEGSVSISTLKRWRAEYYERFME